MYGTWHLFYGLQKYNMNIRACFGVLGFAGALIAVSGDADATPLLQYASSVIGYSSQWSPTVYSAARALGAPDTFNYGDWTTAWSPRPVNGTLEFIALGFSTPVYATGATIRETDGNGFVYQVDAIDTAGRLHNVWSGRDPSAPGRPVNFALSWSPTSYAVSGLKIYTDTNHDISGFEEIDAVQLAGNPVPVPEPASLFLVAGGFGLLGFNRRRAR